MGARARSAGIRGIHVAMIMVAFFAVIIGLDALFITLAIRSHPGEQVKNSYVLGLEYNKELARRTRQQELGWTVEAGPGDDGATFRVRLRNAAGQPLQGMAVALRAHVVGLRQDEPPVWLAETVPGDYAMALALEGPARIEARLEISKERDSPIMFEAVKMVVLQ